MTMTDPVADMLTRIRNAVQARHDVVQLPASKLKANIARILKEEGFIDDFEVVKEGPQGHIKLRLRYLDRKQPVITGLKRVSKPGRRVYVQHKRIPSVLGGLGHAILTTPQGLMTGARARKANLGGEYLVEVC